MSDWSTVISKLSEATGKAFRSFKTRPVPGGCINTATKLETPDGCYFVKETESSPTALTMFEAEADGLAVLAAAEAIRVPAPICWGTDGERAFLVLEWLDLKAAGSASQSVLGRQLAALHHVSRPWFGWDRANTIGATPQHNTPSEHWVDFLREQRLGFQFRLVAENGFRTLATTGEKLLGRLEQFFRGYAPSASLLHGDLWGGNVGETAPGQPAIFDPAVYFGDRETDLAMTELFGGFSKSFYQSYGDSWPLADGYELRKSLYNLYHVLNHLNLFGSGYLGQAQRTVDRLLAEIR